MSSVQGTLLRDSSYIWRNNLKSVFQNQNTWERKSLNVAKKRAAPFKEYMPSRRISHTITNESNHARTCVGINAFRIQRISFDDRRKSMQNLVQNQLITTYWVIQWLFSIRFLSIPI